MKKIMKEKKRDTHNPSSQNLDVPLVGSKSKEEWLQGWFRWFGVLLFFQIFSTYAYNTFPFRNYVDLLNFF